MKTKEQLEKALKIVEEAKALYEQGMEEGYALDGETWVKIDIQADVLR